MEYCQGKLRRVAHALARVMGPGEVLTTVTSVTPSAFAPDASREGLINMPAP